jgi:two-component system, cell cycle sensor histidine kinase DivJ
MAASERQWVGLVHPTAEANREALVRHLWFVCTRLALGAAALASVPVLLALHGAVEPAASFAVALLAGQAALAVLCARTGRLTQTYTASLAAMGVLSCFLSYTGAMGGPAALGLLPILIVEAAIVAGRREFKAAVVLGLAAPVALAGLQSVTLPREALAGWDFVAPALQQGLLALVAFGLGYLALREIRQRQIRERQLAIQAEIIARGFGDLVTRHDRQGQVISAGPTARAALGVSPEQLLGRGMFDLVHVGDRPLFLKALSDAAQGGGLTRAQVRLRCPLEGEGGRAEPPVYRWFDLRVQLVGHLDNGGDEGDEVVCVLRDVTEQLRHEDEIEQARIQAVSANETKTGFLATVSHELRTPLNAIIGFSEMLSSDKLTPTDDERRRDYARIIHVSGQHLLDVVNTLLDISRIDSGTMQLDPEPFSLDGLVAGTLEMIALKAEQARISLVSQVEPGMPQMLADRRAVKQILLNLVSNGVKFTPTGGCVSVHVSREGDHVRMSVEDTGIGIRADDMPRLGEPFFQAQSSYDRRYEGTGLGLSVVKGLVALHGGSVAIESQFGQGTRVSVRLPLLTQARPTSSIVTSLPTAEPVVPASVRRDLETVVKKRA